MLDIFKGSAIFQLGWMITDPNTRKEVKKFWGVRTMATDNLDYKRRLLKMIKKQDKDDAKR
ncbi:MAG: hypothetical protein DYG83_16345 [Candidatus Brocadia sp. AMX2]|uniref:Uncharacterized protein n=1 Tax=Candidatus Brocadia sinica JPN1 TaxID=1197129 RepID=A0ABQ0K0L7_9BACT|nr:MULTISPECIES: hypothetical protein [Brocadia]KXK31453.1 MAG: hypothetical protein UZ01_00843 [Candidatus Brocadia sinica]MBC6933876.1 hypothetical protein [Candidatus Brocadia sp.]MBL1170590.1 hypothetical protein [Candidatus Brocadia sp. AMX1]NOG42342.1 hypothetical protein [Planctomycetota bacterium]KAA0242307.1 MAG: hypothetical protein EDM70_14785 [Candidatus Brocadia sp. AMX2]